MSENTTSTQSTQRPLTAAERQDLYRSSIGNILNTYTQSGLPYGGTGSMNPTVAKYNPTSTPATATSTQGGAFTIGDIYNAGGTQSNYNKGGTVTLDPKTYFQAPNPDTNMPTGAADPGGINLPVYQTPDYQSPGAYQGISNGDYNKLQTDVLSGYTAGLDYDKSKAMSTLNDSLAKRGIWSSGAAVQAENDLNNSYSGAYGKAGADATSNRYSLESADKLAENNYNQTAAKEANTYNQTNTQNQFSAGYAPLNYLSNLWNGTAGTVGGSSTFGQGLAFNI